MDILKEFLINLPLSARIVAYIIGIVVWTWFMFMYPSVKHEHTVQKTEISVVFPEKEIKENERKKAKIQINRIIEDASLWIEGKTAQNKTEIDKIVAHFNSRGVLHSGMHIAEHINRVNNFIKSINDYIRDMNRKIEDLLINAEEEKFENVSWLKDEYQSHSSFITKAKRTKEAIKKQNDELCSRFTDQATFNNILRSKPYDE